MASSFAIAQPALGGFVDSIEVDPCGIIRITGWLKSDFDTRSAPSIRLDGQSVPFLQFFRFRRPDVVWAERTLPLHAGLALDYLVPEPMIGRASVLELDLDENRRLRFNADFGFINPDYRPLFNAREVFHREHIYGSGAPNKIASSEVVEVARALPGPLLDFGCGRGVLIGELRRLGTEAYGLELDTELIRSSIPSETKSIVTLYNGSFPSPFEDGCFRSVICSEVLEHIPDYQSAIADIARIATEQVVFTVPDASAIPLGFRHGAVPWHLMESTHINFFNQQSLEFALRPSFSKMEFGRTGWCQFNDSPYYVSLMALCWK